MFPPGVGTPRRFVGRESLEAVLGEDGVVYVPRKESQGGGENWVPARTEEGGGSVSSSETRRWSDVGVLGTGEWVGILGTSPLLAVHSAWN